MPTSMVLRFRDLATQQGFTITLHRDLINQHGYVWWGWWALPKERIPRAVFADFTTTARKTAPLIVYLLDSGRHLTYIAKVTDIKVSDTEDPIGTPEPDKTPTYYIARTCKTWFKFVSMEECDKTELSKFSYDEVKEVLDDPTSDTFQNKRIFSIDEMISRLHRTIYFVQPYKEGAHKTHEVKLSAPLREPRLFVVEPRFKPSNYMIHLSDLHFGAHHAFPMSDGPKKSLSSLIIQDIKSMYSTPPAALLISGDLTWQAKPEEFTNALSLISTLRTIFELDPYYDLIVVPGNHDILWAEQEDDKYDPEKPVQFSSEVAQKNYVDFFLAAFGLPPNQHLTLGRRYLLSNYVTVDVLGLNSTRLEDRQFAGYGFVGLEQLEQAASSLSWKAGEQRVTYRIMTMHHHLIPATPVEEITTRSRNYDLTLDAGQLMYKALQLNVDMVSHGHRHQPFISCISRPPKNNAYRSSQSLAVHGTGSSGVDREHLGTIGKNCYSVYEFDSKVLTIKVRATSDDFEGFAPYWTIKLERTEKGLQPVGE